ncbi:MAG: formylglycine-generating enzyme family protein [Leptospiraceae bacterium]|nr:formylglycine-generating enzyme family protein [Leptospiraceae bacterium]MCP5494309.1 formylglycine-generating enzyme family protein [Leptospiraceae bacterium]
MKYNSGDFSTGIMNFIKLNVCIIFIFLWILGCTSNETKESPDTTKKPKVETEKPEAKVETEVPIDDSAFENSICMQFVKIPAGEFLMGKRTDLKFSRDETPKHTVKITKPFYMGKYEVTQEQWKKVMGVNNNPSNHKGDNLPVENVSWNDVQDYINRLNQLEGGNNYRLPTEAEWEYAATSGTNFVYYWGDTVGVNNANCDGCGSQWDNRETAPVGSFKPNSYGLYDMAGNVWEWVEDWYDQDYYLKSPVEDPINTEKSRYKVLRGGSWFDKPEVLRPSARLWDYPHLRFINNGFRLVSNKYAGKK